VLMRVLRAGLGAKAQEQWKQQADENLAWS
jgi:hypothetical protein